MEETTRPGSPSAWLLLRAYRDSTKWLGLSGRGAAEYVGVEEEDLREWEERPNSFPVHQSTSVILGLWAALSGAEEEFGTPGTMQRIYASGYGGENGPSAAELLELLIDAAEQSSIKALEEAYET